jgi:formylglycine-generating enzyme required for sulfatase activity
MSFPATVSTFRLDKYEITVGRFRTFVNAGMGTQLNPPAAGAGAHANISGSGWDPQFNAVLPANTTELNAQLHCDSVTHLETWTDAPGPNENKPLNCLTWYEAMAFCASDGGFLPTEAEWNDAATGGNEQRAFPWSVPPGDLDHLDINHASFSDGVRCPGDGSPDCILVVGSLPAGDGRFGHSDLAGNLNEWVLDTFQNPYRLITCVDCADLTPQPKRTFRGGSFGSFAAALRTGARTPNNPGTALFSFGARCARPALPPP